MYKNVKTLNKKRRLKNYSDHCKTISKPISCMAVWSTFNWNFNNV